MKSKFIACIKVFALAAMLALGIITIIGSGGGDDHKVTYNSLNSDGGGALPSPDDGGGASPSPADGAGASPSPDDGGGASPPPDDGGGAPPPDDGGVPPPDGGGGGNIAPVLTDLKLNPVSATVNEGLGTADCVFQVDFEDPDGDVIYLQFTTSNGDDEALYLQGGATSVRIEHSFEVSTVIDDSLLDYLFNFDIWVVDSRGNKSNVLSDTFSITEDLDITFGQNGIVIYDDAANGLDEEALGMALQDDGKIVVVGRKFNGSTDDVLVQRYSAIGALDSSFAVNGTFLFDSGESETAYALAMQPDGKIVVAGYIHETNAGNENILVMRLNVDGTLDSSFGTNGIATTDVSVDGEYGYAVTIQADGKIVVAGEVAIDGTNVEALVLRYNPDGSIDGTFGSSGIFRYSDSAGGWDQAYGVALQTDGKVVVTGATSTQGAVALTNVLVLRLNTDGTLDNTFGNGGVVHYKDIYESGRSVLVQSDGQIVIGASRWDYNSINNAALIIRLNSDGTLDSDFGQGGVVTYKKEYGFPSISANAVALTDDGNIVLVGHANYDTLVIRVTSNGSYDTTLSVDGISSIASGGYGQGKGVVLLNDGSIIVAGNSTFHDQYSDQAVFLAKLTGQ